MTELGSTADTLSPLPGVLFHGLIAVSTFGLLSFFCSVSLFFYLTYRLISWRRQSGVKSPTNQFLFLIYNLLLADIQQAIAFLLNISALRNNAIIVRTTTCFAQGWFISTGDLASSVFIFTIAAHTFMSVVKNYRLPTWAFYSVVTFNWIFVYVMAAIGPIIHNKDDFYVRATAWCWINSKYSDERLWLHYFWIFIAMFSTVLIYVFILFWMRRKSRDGSLPSKVAQGATPLMILYPLIYSICTAPLAIGRIAALAGADVSYGYFCMAGSLIACNGWLDVLLYASTRSDIVFAEFPPSEDTGLDTFGFLGKQHTFGNTTTITGGGMPFEGTRSRQNGGRSSNRLRNNDSMEGLYVALGEIEVKGEVTVQSEAMDPTLAARGKSTTQLSDGKESLASNGKTWGNRSVLSVESH